MYKHVNLQCFCGLARVASIIQGTDLLLMGWFVELVRELRDYPGARFWGVMVLLWLCAIGWIVSSVI